MTTREAAEYLRTSEDSLKRFARAGRIPAAKLGRAWRFVKDDLDEWLVGGGTRNGWDDDAHFVAECVKAASEPRKPLAQIRAERGL